MNIFDADWIDCQLAHYEYLKDNDHKTSLSFSQILNQLSIQTDENSLQSNQDTSDAVTNPTTEPVGVVDNQSPQPVRKVRSKIQKTEEVSRVVNRGRPKANINRPGQSSASFGTLPRKDVNGALF